MADMPTGLGLLLG